MTNQKEEKGISNFGPLVQYLHPVKLETNHKSSLFYFAVLLSVFFHTSMQPLVLRKKISILPSTVNIKSLGILVKTSIIVYY